MTTRSHDIGTLDSQQLIPGTPFSFACPQCRGVLERRGPDDFYCSNDRLSFHQVDGIWRMLLHERAEYFAKFVQDYETVRFEERRGADDPRYYQSLPFADTTGRFTEDWSIRATSFRALLARVIEPAGGRLARPMTILDIGAGNGWLSNHLAGRGHNVAAVDLLINEADGLGTHVYYNTAFVPVQAEFDRLPFASSQIDLVVFNGSLHYSTDFAETLREALRVLRPGGQLAIVDSPVYQSASSGAAMVREREEQFRRLYGFPSNSTPSENFLTFSRLKELGAALNLEWRLIQPFYSVSWALRPLKARLRGHREPARFLVMVGTRPRPWSGTATSLQTALGKRLVRWRYHLTQRRRYNRLSLEEVTGRHIVVLPEVFNPKLLHSGEFLASVLNDCHILSGSTVLDMGTGSGIGAVTAATWASRIVAVDINPRAVRCARINVLLNEVEHKIDVRQGDLFVPLQGERFDVVLFNPPYFRGAPNDALDHAWRSVDVVERFAAGLRDHLTADGYALIVLSTEGDTSAFLESFEMNNFDITIARKRDLLHESLTVYRLTAKGRFDADSL
ncbi:MAG: class I SAM-dependent methyltransferase [Chloroflexia bacterium]|nr:class I SAM-dependent methyltransferase [Chloroflexia bacterium]